MEKIRCECGNGCDYAPSTYEKVNGLSCNNSRNRQYRVLSPDGIDIAPTTYSSQYEARKALAEWIQRYSRQGYYSQTCYNGYVRHIHLHELPDYCEIIKA